MRNRAVSTGFNHVWDQTALPLAQRTITLSLVRLLVQCSKDIHARNDEGRAILE